MIWIIAGTSEARELIERVKDLDNYIATIATEGGKEFINTHRLIVGRMSHEEMMSFCQDRNISLIVDLTHPYAEVVSHNAKRIADKLKVIESHSRCPMFYIKDDEIFAEIKEVPELKKEDE